MSLKVVAFSQALMGSLLGMSLLKGICGVDAGTVQHICSVGDRLLRPSKNQGCIRSAWPGNLEQHLYEQCNIAQHDLCL